MDEGPDTLHWGSSVALPALTELRMQDYRSWTKPLRGRKPMCNSQFSRSNKSL